MSLPPERLSIKRRRDEDPVDKLYIDEAEPSTKRIITRRFTEYYFQRVPANTPADVPLQEPSSRYPQRILRTPRSVNSLNVTNPRARAFKPNGVPIVRATAPGDEFRDAQRALDARRQAADIFTNAQIEVDKRKEQDQNIISVIPDRVVPIYKSSSGIGSMLGDGPNIPEESVVRRFRITPSGLNGGIQKNRVRKVGNGIAVLVEQERISSSRHSPVTELLSQEVDTQMQLGQESTEVPTEDLKTPLRKRPVVNKAELKWRQEQHRTVSAAKSNIASAIEKKAREKNTTWDEQADRLAQEFEQVALDIEEQDKAELSPVRHVSSFQAPKYTASKPKQHKFKPHQPIKPRGVPVKAESVESTPMNAEKEHVSNDVSVELQQMDTETDYVVDMFIRIPMTESDGLMNPLASAQDQKSKDPRVGLITITAEDQKIWDDFAEYEEDEKWDSEDADSNAEDNPANEYPDEPSEGEESDDDGTAKEWRNRYNRALYGRSNPLSGYDCEEEYDYACDDYDDGVQFAGWRDDPDCDSNIDSD